MKWLRYYLDFCTKYSFPWSEDDSLPAFLIKLKSKNQQPFMLEQARKAVCCFLKMETSHSPNPPIAETSKEDHEFSISYPKQKEVGGELQLAGLSTPSSTIVPPAQSVEKEAVEEKLVGADWRHVYAKLESSIRMRHSSPKTLKSYIG